MFNENHFKEDICYAYQSLRRYLAKKDYENLKSFSENVLNNIKYFTDFHGDFHTYERFNFYLWKPIFIGILLHKDENKAELLKRLEPGMKVKKFKLFFNEAKEYIKNNNL